MQRGTVRNTSGVVLIALIVLIVLGALLLGVSMHLYGVALDQGRIAQSVERVRNVAAAMVGPQYVFNNESGSNTGFFSRANTKSFPASVNALANTDVAATTDVNATDLPIQFLGASPRVDGYGREIRLTVADPTVTITSQGQDSLGASAHAQEDDITMSYPVADYASGWPAVTNGVPVAIRLTDSSLAPRTFNGAIPYQGYIRSTPATSLSNSGNIIFDENDLQVVVVHPNDLNRQLNTAFFTGVAARTPVQFEHNNATGYKGYFLCNASYGWNVVYVQPRRVGGSTYDFDPFWNSGPGASYVAGSCVLAGAFFVAPFKSTAGRQRFDMALPVTAQPRAIRDPSTGVGAETSTIHPDKVIINRAAPNAFDKLGASGSDYYLAVGNSNFAEFGGGNFDMRSIVEFSIAQAGGFRDLSVSGFGGSVTGSKVVSATLRLFKANGGFGTGTIEVRQYTQSFGTGETDPSLAWFLTSPGFNTNIQCTWGPVADFSANLPHVSVTVPYGYHDFDVTTAARNWINNSGTNNGLLIYVQAPAAGHYWPFYSSECSSKELHPTLIIAYYREYHNS